MTMLSEKKKDYNPARAAMNSNINEEYVEENITKIRDKDVEIVMQSEEAISKKMANASPLRKFAEIGKIMLAMLKDIRNGSYHEIPWFSVASIALALLYVLNPLDVIPDFIPVIGYIDDMFVMSLALGWVETDLHKYLDWRIEETKGKTS